MIILNAFLYPNESFKNVKKEISDNKIRKTLKLVQRLIPNYADMRMSAVQKNIWICRSHIFTASAFPFHDSELLRLLDSCRQRLCSRISFAGWLSVRTVLQQRSYSRSLWIYFSFLWMLDFYDTQLNFASEYWREKWVHCERKKLLLFNINTNYGSVYWFLSVIDKVGLNVRWIRYWYNGVAVGGLFSLISYGSWKSSASVS